MDRAVNLQIDDSREHLNAEKSRRLHAHLALIDRLERLVRKKGISRPAAAANSLGVALN